MQEPFYNTYSNNQRFPLQNNIQWRPNFTPRGPPFSPRFRGPGPSWRQHAPEQYSNEFWCETCDRGFRSADILEGHKQQHQKCNIDGCQFIAHPKVITKHIQMQHASGLYKKISKLQDPEEIKKWREERKNKYPTKENVAKAAAAIKEKIERGEKMGLKNKRHEKTHKREESGMGGIRKSFDKQNTHKPRSNQNSAPESKRRKFTPKYTVQKLPVAEDTRKLKPFAGIQELMVDTDTEEPQDEPECDFTIEDEDEEVDTNIPSETTSGSVCHALSSLMCNYGSSDEEEVDNTKTISTSTKTCSTNTLNIETANQAVRIQTESVQIVEKPTISQAKNESDDDSGPEEVKVTKPVETNITEPIETKPLMNKRKPKENIRQKPVCRRPRPKVPSTLLQKLLFKEMRHERNIVLQCIRHIIRNNFFDKSE